MIYLILQYALFDIITQYRFKMSAIRVISNNGCEEGYVNACFYIAIKQYMNLIRHEDIKLNTIRQIVNRGRNDQQMFDTDNVSHRNGAIELSRRYRINIYMLVVRDGESFGAFGNIIETNPYNDHVSILQYHNHFELIISETPRNPQGLPLTNHHLRNTTYSIKTIMMNSDKKESKIIPKSNNTSISIGINTDKKAPSKPKSNDTEIAIASVIVGKEKELEIERKRSIDIDRQIDQFNKEMNNKQLMIDSLNRMMTGNPSFNEILEITRLLHGERETFSKLDNQLTLTIGQFDSCKRKRCELEKDINELSLILSDSSI